MPKGIIFICGAVLLIAGCTHTGDGDIRFLPDQYVNKVEYNSLYHYGYNQGCESALAKVNVVGNTYSQDSTLINISTRFKSGWQQGYSACESGTEKMLYKLSNTQ